MIDRIMHHVHTSAGLNCNQHGFIPQTGTVDAGLADKGIIEGNLKEKNSTSVVSLDVREAFDAAWWLRILHNLKELNCPRKLFNLSRNYFSDRTVSLLENELKIENPVTMGCPQYSCSGPGFLEYTLQLAA